MIQIEITRIGSSQNRDLAKAVEVCVKAFDPNAAGDSPAKGGTCHTMYFPDKASATSTAIKTVLAKLEREPSTKDDQGNVVEGAEIVDSSPRHKLIAWVKANRTNIPKDFTPKKKSERALENVAE